MYNKFFGFNLSPFSNTPDPAFYFETEGHKEALATMIYGVEQGKGFVMVTGDVGMGKTLLKQTLKQELGDTYIFIDISNPWSTPEEILNAIRLSISVQGQENNALFDGLRERLIELSQQGRHVLLVIDEAHQMSERMIEGVRLLSNIETTTEKLLQIVLIGQNELAEMLGQYSMRQIKQRLFLSHHLESLNLSENLGYIQHRLTVAGGATDIFTRDAISLIYSESQGIPRVINQLCDNALLFAFGRESKQVEIDDVRKSIETLHRWTKPLHSIDKEAAIPEIAPPPQVIKEQPVDTRGRLPFDIPIASRPAEVIPEKKSASFSSLPTPQRQEYAPAHGDNQSFLNLPISPPRPSVQPEADPIDTKGLIKTLKTAGRKELVLPVLIALGVGVGLSWFSIKQIQGNSKNLGLDTGASNIGQAPVGGESLSLSMTNSIASKNTNSAPLIFAATPATVPWAEAANSSAIPMPLSSRLRVVNVPKEGGMARVATESIGLWNESARDLIYAANPELHIPLTELPSGTPLKIPNLSRDGLVVKAPNGSFHIYYGTFATAEEAQAELQVIRRIWNASQIQTITRQNIPVYRLFVGPFTNKTEATAALESMWFKHLPVLN